ncbi:MAG: response regulator transcription factor [Gammaproteobacteria bacterium]|nr:response regulator transcription factor [Gammaproteobacteria bacterium]
MSRKALQPPYRVLLVEDHKFIAELLAKKLSLDGTIQVIGIASSGATAEQMVSQNHVDIVLLDIQLEQESGVGVAKRLMALQPDIRILALSALDQGPYPLALLQTGAVGFLSKRITTLEIADAVRRVAGGEMAISPGVAAYLATQRANADPFEWLALLTPKETEILALLAQGSDVKQIANHLVLSAKTVQTHRKNLRKKLHVSTDVELCLLAIKAGLLDVHQAGPGAR